MNPDLIIALAALATSVISLGASVHFSRQGQEHNRRSVLPIPYVERSDYLRRLEVRICNHGTGPMIVRKLTAAHGSQADQPIMKIIPDPPAGFVFADYGNFEDPRPIAPEGHVIVIAAEFDPQREAHSAYHATLRAFLADTTLRCTYTDVYGSAFRDHVTRLDWFGKR
jgi:hypothetical protein